MKHTLNWFEIPTTNLSRAQAFYETVLATKLKHENFFGIEMSIFPREGDSREGVTGALVNNPKLIAGASGSVVYLDARGDLDGCIARTKAAGGEVLMPKTSIGPMGFIALIADTEGNRVGLHTEV